MTTFQRKLTFLAQPLLALALSLTLAACETPVQTQRLPEITFTHLGTIDLNVAKIEVVADYRPPMAAPNVDHLFPTPPIRALRTWANDRLRAVGRAGTARFVIKNASATETALPQEKGLTAAFTNQQAQRYDLTAEAFLSITDGPSRGHAEAQASRFTTVAEDISLNDREKTWFSLTEKLMTDFDREMAANIRRHLGHWLK